MADEQNNLASPVGTASAELRAIVEALVFASPEPVTLKVLFKLLADEPQEDVIAAVGNAIGAFRKALDAGVVIGQAQVWVPYPR